MSDRRESAWLFAMGYVVLLAIPSALVIVAIARLRTVESSILVPTAVVTVPVQRSLFTESAPVKLVPNWNEPVEIAPPSWSGIVTAIMVSNDQLISNGDPILSIDSVTRIGFHSGLPFFRSLEVGSTGLDVTELQAMLRAMQLSTQQPNSKFDRETLSGVRRLAELLGVQGRVNVFDATWVVWLPNDQFEIGKFTVRINGEAPPRGTPWLSGRRQLRALQVLRIAQDQSTSPLDSGSWTISIDASAETFAWTPPNEIDESALARIERALPTSATDIGTTGRAVATDSIEVSAVPASSVVEDHGKLCVFTSDSAGGFISKAIRLQDGAQPVGAVTLIVPVPNLADVVANPSDIAPASRVLCDSS